MRVEIMYPQMEIPRPSTSDAKISAFEAERNIRLPATYKAFLLATNGGVPRHGYFSMPSRPPVPYDHVQDFLGIDASIPTSELANNYDFYAGKIPFGIVPIANQDFGSYVCLELRGSKEGVVFWDHRHFWSTGEWRERDLYHIADTFEEFLSLLRLKSI